MARLVALFALVVSLLLPLGPASASDGYFPANAFAARFCAGMTAQFRPENASRVDCLSPTEAIVVEFQDYWREAIGQALAFAAEQQKKPGIVLVCRNDEEHCMNASAAIRGTFAHFAVPLTLWDCGIMSTGLANCTRRDCGPNGCS